MTQRDTGGMGMKKHGRSGHNGKSPALRQAMRREAEKNVRMAPKSTCNHASVSEAFSDR